MAARSRSLLRGAALLCVVAAGDSLSAHRVAHGPLGRVVSRHALRARALGMVQLEAKALTLSNWLEDLGNPGLARTLEAIFSSAAEVAGKIRTSSCDSVEGCFNTLGALDDEQFAIDLLANEVRALAVAAPAVSAASWAARARVALTQNPLRLHLAGDVRAPFLCGHSGDYLVDAGPVRDPDWRAWLLRRI